MSGGRCYQNAIRKTPKQQRDTLDGEMQDIEAGRALMANWSNLSKQLAITRTSPTKVLWPGWISRRRGGLLT
jgi:hypothetical protein